MDLKNAVKSIKLAKEVLACEEEYRDDPIALVAAVLAIKVNVAFVDVFRWVHCDPPINTAQRVFLLRILPLARSGDEAAKQFMLDNAEKLVNYRP